MPNYTSGKPSAGGASILVEPGIYRVRVMKAEEGQSANGNDMIDLICHILPLGAIVYDNLVFMEQTGWKIDNFRASTGDEVIEGENFDVTPEWCVGRIGWCSIGNKRIEKGRSAGKTVNEIKSWMVGYTPEEGEYGSQRPPPPTNRQRQSPPPNSGGNNDVGNDDIPF